VKSKTGTFQRLILLIATANQPLWKKLKRVLLISFFLVFFQQPAWAEKNTIEVIRLQNRPAAEIQELLAPMLENGEIVTGNGFDLIVKSRPDRLESIRELTQQLDRRQHNLIISVLQNSHKSAAQLNAEASVQSSEKSIRMQGMIGDTRDIDSQRNLQQLRTLEGQAAHIQVGTIRPIENVTVYDAGYGYPGAISTTHMQEASSGFAAIPRLTNNQEIILDISPWSDRFLNRASLETQDIQSTIRAQLGEWVELGGVFQHQQSDRHNDFQGLNHSTRNQDNYILIKVDLSD
jgi:type II secretory pathway component GspD/PulD (secretin)